MSVLVTFNSTPYLIPTVGENDWATTVTAFLADVGGSAVTATAVQTLGNKAIQLQNGTAGAPSLAFSTDTASGLYSPSSGQIALATGGQQRLVINAAGQVTIPNANITGGAINGAAIGAITPSTIAATTIAATSTITSRAASGGASLNSDGTGRGYVAFANASNVSQGWLGYLNGNSLDLQTAGSTAIINLNAATTNVQTALTVGSTITLNNAQSLFGTDSGGTPRALVSLSNDNYHNVFVPNAGTKWRVMNLAQSTELLGVTNAGNVTVAGTASITGSLSAANVFATSTITAGGLATLNAGLSIAGGNITGSGTSSITMPVGLFTADGSMYFSPQGGGRLLQFATNWYLGWTVATGDLYWQTPSGQHMVLRSSDGLIYNNRNAFAGNGAYVNLSDERLKHDIVDYTSGLPAVAALRPVQFERVGRPGKQEVGFIAQEVRAHLPHAVHEHADTEDGPPLLAISSETITAALVNAVKTLDCRVSAIEARARKRKTPC